MVDEQQQQQQQQVKAGRQGDEACSRGGRRADNDETHEENGAFDRRSVQTASKKRRQFRSTAVDRHIQLPVGYMTEAN